MTQKTPPNKAGTKNHENRLVWITLAIAVLLGLTDFFYEQHGHFEVEHIKGFYAFFGFAALVVLFLIAKLTSPLLTRDESYYAPTDTVTEDYPEDQLAREKQDV